MIKKIFNAIKKDMGRLPSTAVFGAGWMMNGDWGWDNMMGWGFGGGILGVMIMIFFWIIVILAAVALFRWLTGNLTGGAYTSNRALDILKEKYAKGEITKEEFEAKKKDIM